MTALEQGISYLSCRPCSCKELRTKLLQKGICEEDTEAAISRLLDYGYLNDARYASDIVRYYSRKGYGLQRIRLEFQKRGIPRELWEDALAETPESADCIDRILCQKLHNPEDSAEIRRVSSMLSRRGFAWEDIRAALERIRSEGI